MSEQGSVVLGCETSDEPGKLHTSEVPALRSNGQGLTNLLRIWWKARGFLLRDLRVETSYKFQFVWSFATVLFTIATFYFVSKLIGESKPPACLAEYGGDYFGFVVVGVVMSQYLEASLTGTTTAVRQAMNQGTLEIMYASPTRPITILAFSAIWQFVFETVRVLFCLTIASTVLGFKLVQPNWLSAAVTVIVTVPAFLSVGVLSASVLILCKRGDPVNWFVVSAAALLGGVLFPVSQLPRPLQIVSMAVPLTHALNSFRGALLRGLPVSELWPSLLPLGLFAIIMVPVAWWVSDIVLKRAKMSGTLGAF